MRRFVKCIAVAVLAATAGALSLLPSQGQVGGPPPGVIVKNPAESELAITVEMGQAVYIETATAAEFVRFRINQQAFVYLYSVAPSGEVRLLLPNRAAVNNFLAAGEYAFPEDFMPGFTIGPPGTYYVQAIATLLPIDLKPGSELFRLLGIDPETSRRAVERLITSSGLTAAQWAANWTQYSVVKTQPTAGGYGKVTLKVADPKNAAITDALVKIEKLDNQGNPVKTELDWRTVGPSLTWQLEAGVKYRLQARRPTLYTPDPQRVCQLRGVSLSPCVIELVANDNLQISFTLQPIEGPVALFEVQTPQGPCVGKEIRFDASKSRPQDKIVSYLWDFGDDTLEKKPKGSSTTSHVYLLPGRYTVRLIVEFTGGDLLSTTATVEVQRPATLPACLTSPPRTIELFPSNDGTRANAVIEGGAHTHTVRHGFAATLALVALPKQGDLKLNFKYEVMTFPEGEVQAGEVFAQSFLSVVFVDKDEKPILQSSQIFSVIELGKTPPMGEEIDFPIPRIPVPAGAKGIRATLVTIVQARTAQTAPPGIPVTITYSGFRPEQEKPLSCQQVPLLLEPDRLAYGRGETVNWTFTNRLAQAVTLLRWQITDRQGGVIFGPVALNELKVEPNLSVRRSWEGQKDNQGKLAAAGLYTIILEAREMTCMTIFEIGP